MDVDITWNQKLKPYGFKVFPKNWDGKSSFVSIDKIIKRWDCIDVKVMKHQFIQNLDNTLKERRKLFLNEFFIWVGKINR